MGAYVLYLLLSTDQLPCIHINSYEVSMVQAIPSKDLKEEDLVNIVC